MNTGIIRNAAIATLISTAGLTGAFHLVDKWEGNRTTVYKDVIGIKTICRGHTGPLVNKGTVTQDECDRATYDDLVIAKRVVESCVTANLTDGEWSAWTSFALNVGPGKKGVKDGMCVLKNGNQPTHLKLLNSGRNYEACQMLMKWTNAGGQFTRGLYNRRVDEVRVCIKDLQVK